MTAFLLVHAPLLGPVSWRPCARALRGVGHDVSVPDLRGAVAEARGWWRRAAYVCAAAADEHPVVVGHSGAGVLLPVVAAAVSAPAVVFVDAVLPADRGQTVAGEDLLAFVRRFPADEPLPPWSAWWSPQILAEMLPDAAMREAVQADEPRLPRDFYDEPVPVPDGWKPATVTYVRLSPAYDAHADRARALGWQVVDLPGQHLDVMMQPERVAAVLGDAVG